MPATVKQLDKAVADAIERARRKTDDNLAGKAAALTRLTDEEIQQICPTPADVEKLAELIRIVQNATEQNNRVNALVANIESLAPVVLGLLKKVVV